MRLRGDASAAVEAGGLAVRFGSEETLLIEGARGVEDAREELAARGLLTDAPEAEDWRAVLSVPPGARVHVVAPSPEFASALSAQGLLGDEDDASAGLFVEMGVDLPGREAFERSARARGRSWLWMQLPSFDEARWTAFVPGETACARCLEARLLANRRNADRYRTVLEANGRRLPMPLMPAAASLAAGLAALECARLLSGGAAGSVGRLTSFDLSRFVLESERVLPLPGCEVCGC